MSSVWPYHFFSGVVLLLVFMVFFLFVFGSFLLSFESRELVGKEEI